MKLLLKVQYIFLMLLMVSGCSNITIFDQRGKKNLSYNGKESYGDKVRQRLVENVPNYRFCLEKYLTPTESGVFKGAVTFSFSINKHGTVKEVAVISDQLKNLKAKGCLIKTITMLEMPKHDKNSDFKVRQPLGISMQ